MVDVMAACPVFSIQEKIGAVIAEYLGAASSS
jgi:hypothetical protein